MPRIGWQRLTRGRLERMIRAIEPIDRHTTNSNEALVVVGRLSLTSTLARPDTSADRGQDQGPYPYERFTEAVGGRLACEQQLSNEVVRAVALETAQE
jgi:hypothetical protein